MKSKIFKILAIVLVLLGGAFVFLNYYLENKVEEKINNLGRSALTYGKIEVSLLQRQVKLEEVKYQKTGKLIKSPLVEIEGIQFLDYLTEGKLVINNVLIKQPEITFSSGKDSAKTSSEFSENITIKNFKAPNGFFRIKKDDSTRLVFRFPEFSLSGIKLDSSTVKNKIPFKYRNYHIRGDSLRMHLDNLHFISSEEVLLDPKKVKIDSLKILPYVNDINFTKQLEYEKDRIILNVRELVIDSLDFGYLNDSLFIKSPKVSIKGADLEIFRDKSPPDNPEPKFLYSELLQRSPVKLSLKEVDIKSAKIVYQEKIDPSEPPAQIGFFDVMGNIENLTNMEMGRKDFPRTKITANASFLKTAPVHLEWSFNLKSPIEKFRISGNFGTIPAEEFNRYLRLKTEKAARGEIESLSFTFTGNEDVAVGDVRVKYDNFRIILMEDDGEEKQDFLTAIANLFVDNDGYSGAFVAENVEVHRERTKSFWFYIWSGIRKGIKEAITQF